ncbi:hypothetical protein FRC12_021411, partial [Ceratobasidium sp. 428]
TGRTVLGPLKAHAGGIWSVAFSVDARIIASSSWDNTIFIWDVEGGTQAVEPLEGHTGFVCSVAFSHDGRLISSSRDCTIRIWDPTTGKPDGPPIDAGCLTWSVAVSPDGTRIAGACQNTIKVYDAATRERLFYCAGHTNVIRSITFSPNGRLIASTSYDCTVRIWDGATGDAIGNPMEGHSILIRSVAFSSDGRFIASGSDDKTIRIWDVETGSMCGDPLSGHTEQIIGVAFILHSNKLISASPNNGIRIWDINIPALQEFRAEISSITVQCQAYPHLMLGQHAPSTLRLQMKLSGI